METIFILIVALVAAVFLYINFKKTGGCDCGNKNCPSKKHSKQ